MQWNHQWGWGESNIFKREVRGGSSHTNYGWHDWNWKTSQENQKTELRKWAVKHCLCVHLDDSSINLSHAIWVEFDNWIDWETIVFLLDKMWTKYWSFTDIPAEAECWEAYNPNRPLSGILNPNRRPLGLETRPDPARVKIRVGMFPEKMMNESWKKWKQIHWSCVSRTGIRALLWMLAEKGVWLHVA